MMHSQLRCACSLRTENDYELIMTWKIRVVTSFQLLSRLLIRIEEHEDCLPANFTGLAVQYCNTTELHFTMTKRQQDSVTMESSDCFRWKCF
jgi:hypothetical protein